MNEEDLVQYLTRHLVDDPEVQKYLDNQVPMYNRHMGEHLTDAENELLDVQEEVYYATRSCTLHRLVALVAASLNI